MKFTISQQEFSKSLNIAGKVLSSKPNLPVLLNLHLSVSKNKLEVLSTDLEKAIKASSLCSGETDGRITVPGKILIEFIGQIPEGDVVVEKLGEEIVISSGGYSARLSTIASEEFPAIPKIEKGVEVEIEGEEFVSLANKVTFAAAQDEGKPVLNGVLCEIGKKKFSMVATDGYRLSFAEIDSSEVKSPIKMVVPASTVSEVARIISENKKGDESRIKLLVSDNLTQVNFKIGEIEFTSRLIENEYPSWQKIIPSTFITKVNINREDLSQKIKTAAIFARDSGNIVKLKFTGNEMAIAASTSQVASNEIKSQVKMTGKGGEIAFNYRYILEALAAIEEEDLFFEMSESLTPGRITAEDAKFNFFHIIMPVRLQS